VVPEKGAEVLDDIGIVVDHEDSLDHRFPQGKGRRSAAFAM
jgi:hypothetical protein